MIKTDICIIGAGPVGLFAVFEAGLLKLKCHLIDALPQVGGQLSEIYPKKPIYDIPGFPTVNAQELVDNLMKQIAPFKPTFTLGERVDGLTKQEDGSFLLTTSDGTEVHAGVVVIAAGLGSFEPRKPVIENLEKFEGKGVDYMVKDPEKYRDKKIVIAGGGDSALDWTIFLSEVAKEVTLVHRNQTFRGALDSADKVFELAQENKIRLLLNSNLHSLDGDGVLKAVHITDQASTVNTFEADYLIPLFGLSPKLGPIADWNLGIDKSAIVVNTEDYSTNVPGIYAIGDINTYAGKLKLILCGFHEAALMAQSAFKYIYPDQKLSFKYTTVNGITPL
ncbi:MULTISPECIES: NAD(P)/FAD-dependent oxidoreductase [unclassified Imperialibacter]|uniref:NAD(P)/FAD-dependent oxidoreductase n=1 Tax=unclassified Imperialibacter TaxID=2629706 RepID=UPI0012569B7E|nr:MULTISPECIES: NAD(P)/FAD-dependent oxidoreductase [unclassified Imperialibacter]CAD5295451.1 Ferredoxin--NADP reductase 1 [Imperialibacter sp. 75]CAD5296186.1 Ferredoxin--NADP reductase 1 [Imperialibacter sp. 89]VVT14951.1 Ferredoxin--NADP reductase 1 [Imperialibacter sp. EC-SDR9]